MAYEKTEWVARQGSNLNRFEKDQETNRSVVLQNVPNAVTVKGTKFSPANMNKIEQGIYDAHEMIGSEAQTREQAVQGINTILNDLIALPAWNSSNHILTFTARDGSTLAVDLPLKSLAKDIGYDTSTKEIVITKQDNSQIRVSVADLVDVYTGSLGTHVQVTIEANNTIQAHLREGSITEPELAATLLDTLVRTSGDQTVAGVKTFTSIPLLPPANPTTDDQATRKAYVDAAYNALLDMINALTPESVGSILNLLDQKARKNHASTTTDYGAANGATYGHVRFPTAGTNVNMPRSALPYEYIGEGKVIDLNTYLGAGVYVLYNPLAGSSNFPTGWGTGTNNSAVLEILPFYSSGTVRQVLHKRGTNQIWVRYSTSASAWGEWENFSGKAPLASPELTGTPTAPTAGAGTNNTQIATTAYVDKMFRKGMIYMSVENVNPATFIGGTWTVWGSGRVPVGIDTAQTEFNTAEKTGGANTHTLTVAQMPNHRHNTWDSGAGYGNVGWRDNSPNNVMKTEDDGFFSSWNPNTSYSGNGLSHNNLQPYITCYFFKRTA